MGNDNTTPTSYSSLKQRIKLLTNKKNAFTSKQKQSLLKNSSVATQNMGILNAKSKTIKLPKYEPLKELFNTFKEHGLCFDRIYIILQCFTQTITEIINLVMLNPKLKSKNKLHLSCTHKPPIKR